MENDQQNFQRMADIYLSKLQMEQVEVVVSDHPYFQQNPGAAVTYQHPHIYVHPKWRERSNYVKMLDDMEAVMKVAKKQQTTYREVEIKQTIYREAEVKQTNHSEQTFQMDSDSNPQISARLFFGNHLATDERGRDIPSAVEVVKIKDGGVNIQFEGYSGRGKPCPIGKMDPDGTGDVWIDIDVSQIIHNEDIKIPIRFKSNTYDMVDDLDYVAIGNAFKNPDEYNQIILPDGFEVITEIQKIDDDGEVKTIKKFFIKPREE